MSAKSSDRNTDQAEGNIKPGHVTCNGCGWQGECTSAERHYQDDCPRAVIYCASCRMTYTRNPGHQCPKKTLTMKEEEQVYTANIEKLRAEVALLHERVDRLQKQREDQSWRIVLDQWRHGIAQDVDKNLTPRDVTCSIGRDNPLILPLSQSESARDSPLRK